MLNNKQYVGVTHQGLNKRKNQHKSNHNSGSKFHRAIRKYGFDAFEFKEYACAFTLEDLRYLEVYLIEELNTHKLGYNTTLGGEGVCGIEHSPYSRLKMSEARKRLWQSEEYRSRISIAQKESWKNKSEELRLAHSERALITLKNKPRKERVVKIKAKGPGKGSNMSSKSHCPSGHPYEGENVFVTQTGSRVCKTCKRASRNKARDRKRALARLTR